MRIDHALQGRDNNFNLLRCVAALTVLVGHVLLLSRGEGGPDSIFKNLVGDSASRFAVDAFFVMSGFLVTKSLVSRADLAGYAIARSLRLFPALLVLSLMTAYGLGAILTPLSLWDYLTSWQATKFWLLTSFTFSDSQTLTGVFGNNPVPDVVNGPLWTLKWEALAYLVLPALWFVGGLTSRTKLAALFFTMVAVHLLACLGLGLRVADEALSGAVWVNSLRFGLSFLFGAVCHQFRDRIVLHGGYAMLGIAATLMLKETAFFDVTATLSLGYAVFWLAFVPSGSVRRFNRLGDYSYGIYIYHWPVIQTLIALSPETDIASLLMSALPITLGAAMLSWHLLEQPALAAHDTVTGLWERLRQSPRMNGIRDREIHPVQNRDRRTG